MFGYQSALCLLAGSQKLLCKSSSYKYLLPTLFFITQLFIYFSLEMLDKTDPPCIQDGYCMSVAYACLLDVIRSISLVVQNTPVGITSESIAPSNEGLPAEQSPIDDDSFSIQLVNSSWCGLLAALTLLLEARYKFIKRSLY